MIGVKKLLMSIMLPNIAKALKYGGKIAQSKLLMLIGICLVTILKRIGSIKKFAITMLINMVVIPNQIVQAATTTLLITLTKVNLNASLVLPCDTSRVGKNQPMIAGNITKAEIFINSALSLNFSPNIMMTNGSAIAANPINIGITIVAVITTNFIYKSPRFMPSLTREKLGTTIELIEPMVI